MTSRDRVMGLLGSFHEDATQKLRREGELRGVRVRNRMRPRRTYCLRSKLVIIHSGKARRFHYVSLGRPEHLQSVSIQTIVEGRGKRNMTHCNGDFVERQTLAGGDGFSDGEKILSVESHDDAGRDGTPGV